MNKRDGSIELKRITHWVAYRVHMLANPQTGKSLKYAATKYKIPESSGVAQLKSMSMPTAQKLAALFQVLYTRSQTFSRN